MLNLITRPSSPSTGESKSVAILLNLSRKIKVMRQDVNVSHGTTKMDKRVRRRELPSVGRCKTLYKKQDVRKCDANFDGKKE
jgi:hypothetical protein